jgi:hypothetical protein
MVERNSVDDPVSRLRKLVGKFVLLLAGVWFMILIAVAVALVQGNVKIPALNIVTAIVPGCALVPGAYLSVKLLRSRSPELIKERWVKPGIYGASGLLIGIVAFVALVQVQAGG